MLTEMVKRGTLAVTAAMALAAATGAAADTVRIQDAREAIRDYAAETCGAQFEAVTAIMAETVRASALDSDVAMAKDLGTWTHEWPMSDATLKASAFVSVAQSQALETTLMVNFAQHYAGTSDAGAIEATRYQARVALAKTALATCLRPTEAEQTAVADRVADALVSALTETGCAARLKAATALGDSVLKTASADWTGALDTYGPVLSQTCASGG